jgi:hypothetical protein
MFCPIFDRFGDMLLINHHFARFHEIEFRKETSEMYHQTGEHLLTAFVTSPFCPIFDRFGDILLITILPNF